MNIKIHYGKTINIGNYESIKIDAELGVDNTTTDSSKIFESLYRKCKDFVDKKEEEICGKSKNIIEPKKDPVELEVNDLNPEGFPIINETEKAVCISANNKFAWIPKSCAIIEGDLAKPKDWFEEKVEWKVRQ